MINLITSIEQKLQFRNCSVTLDNILDNSKAASGGKRDVSFLNYLVDNNIIKVEEAVLTRSQLDLPEEYYYEKYKKKIGETDRHFLCRAIIQDELHRIGIESYSETGLGDMGILRANSNYDLVDLGFSFAIDIGLAPARNYFRGLTDLRIKHYLITPFFDDYIKDVIFGVFSRINDKDFTDAVKDYVQGIAVNPMMQSGDIIHADIEERHDSGI